MKALEQIEIAKEKYESGYRLLEGYTEHADKIYLRDIESTLAQMRN